MSSKHAGGGDPIRTPQKDDEDVKKDAYPLRESNLQSADECLTRSQKSVQEINNDFDKIR